MALEFILTNFVLLHLTCVVVHSSPDADVVQNVTTKVRFKISEFNYEHVANLYTIVLWFFVGMIAKIGFHTFQKLAEKVPESCSLIILGLIVGSALNLMKIASHSSFSFNSSTFFFFLLPPIILDSGYFMPCRAFFDNFGTILTFAIFNTLFNTIAIGFTLYGMNFTGIYGETRFQMLHCLLFASIISAVDPVAVLATFEDIHVNDMLYIIVFGESLLNDAVSVVLYRMFASFCMIGSSNINAVDIIFGMISFLVVSIGGVVDGMVFGAIGSFITKFTAEVPVLEPPVIIATAYISYLTAEMLSLSGIIAIIVTGMIMKQYVPYNISKKSSITTEYVIKILSTVTETIIFLFMGLTAINSSHSWNIGFIFVTIFSCLLYRVLGVAIFGTLANLNRVNELSFIDMLVMSYGGLRGAVAFALALILKQPIITVKPIFVTTTIIVIYFTAFVQGATIGPIVKLLKVRRKLLEEPSMNAKLTNRMIDHVMTFLEEVTLSSIGFNARLLDKIRFFDRKYFKPFFLRDKPEEEQDFVFLTNMEKLGAERTKQRFESMMSSDIDKIQLINQQRDDHLVPDIGAINANVGNKYMDDNRITYMLETSLIQPRRKTMMHRRLGDECSPLLSQSHVSAHHPVHYHRRPISPRHILEYGLTDFSQRTHMENSVHNLKQEHDNSTAAERYLPWENPLHRDEPRIAEKPLWVKNPEYITHATTLPVEDEKRPHVKDIFRTTTIQ